VEPAPELMHFSGEEPAPEPKAERVDILSAEA
jgi:hypothetical protein